MRPSQQQDLYKRLGVSKDALASDIKSAFRTIAKKWHPDINPQDPHIAHVEFIAVCEAYEILFDSIQRAEYDSANTTQQDIDNYRKQTSVEDFLKDYSSSRFKKYNHMYKSELFGELHFSIIGEDINYFLNHEERIKYTK